MQNSEEIDMNQFSRTEMLIGKNNLDKIHSLKIAIFGIGGVGSYVAESLARVGVEKFILIDNDKVSITNLNRQIHATHKTITKFKVDVMKERIIDINPNAQVETYKIFYTKNCKEEIINSSLDYIVDAVDSVETKIDLVVQAKEKNIPIISCMGTGNKIEPTKLEVADIYNTSVCPLARIMRKELKVRNIKKLKVVYSKEIPIKSIDNEKNSRGIIGSMPFVPATAGLIIASEIIKEICK